MAAASYTTDLNTITLCESGDSFEEFSGYALGDNAALETDWYLQGNSCASDEANGKTGVGHSIGFDYGSNITFGTGECVFAWMMCMAGNAMDTFANGGYRLLMGDSTSSFKGFYVGGRDFGRNPYGGWVNVCAWPSFSPADVSGSPSAYRHFAVAIVMTSAISKGRPNCMDAMRYGRGQIEVTLGDLSNGYGTFSGIAAVNDSSSNRWGLLQAQGTGYLWKGLLSLGSATTAVDFRDSNKVITVDNTPRTYAAFNRCEVNNSGSRVDWTNISIAALLSGQLAPGEFEAVANATINFDGCTFSDMGSFVFQSNSTIDATTFRRCTQVTQGGAAIDGCLFTNSPAAVSLLVSDLDNVSNCDFVSDGSNHAIELTSAHAAGTFDHIGITYSGYASTDGSTGNESIYNNSGGAVTINVTGGDTPTIRNGTGASTTVVAGAVTVKAIAQTAAGTKIENARVFLFASGTGPFPSDDVVTITNSGTTATVAHTAHGLATNDKIHIRGASIVSNNGVFSITVTGANEYTYTLPQSEASNPTGTIYATFAVLYGLTDSVGAISMSRVFSSDQDISGWARKSTGAPFYKTGPISGTVDSGSGATFTAILSPDQ